MFLHLQAFDKQISVHSKERIEEDEDSEDEPLSVAVDLALNFYKRKEGDVVVLTDKGKRLNINKSAKENGLNENDVLRVTSEDILVKEAKVKKDIETRQKKALEAEKKVKKNAVQ